MRGNVGGVRPALPQHDVQHAVEQTHVGTGLNWQVQIGNFSCVGAARIAVNNFQLRVGGFSVFNTPEQNRVRIRGVAANNENTLRVSNIVIAIGRCVSPQRLFVARHSAAHAQARVGVDIVGANQALGQFIEHVIVFSQQLARDVKTHCIGAVLADDLRE